MSAIESNQDRTDDDRTGEDPNVSEFQSLKREITDAHRERGKWLAQAQECFDFVAGYQWSEDDERVLRGQNRPPITFNRTAPLVKAVCGLEVNNRQAVAYLPRQQGAVGFNETITAAGKWIRDECNAEDEESEAFRDMVICGEGWTETRMDYDDDPMGKVVQERITPMEMGVNKGAFRANFQDARMIYRVREMDPDDVRALLNLPDTLNDAALDASKWFDKAVQPADGGMGNKKDYPNKTRAGIRQGKLTKVTVIQVQYWKREQIHIVATDADEQPQHMSPDEFAKFEERAKMLEGTEQAIGYDATQSVKKVFYECFLGAGILSLEKKPIGFQFKAMTGERDEKAKCFYGMVRDMMDPQRWSNKWLAQTIHIMNSNAKGGLLAETDAFLNQKTAQRNWSDPTKIIWVKPGSLAKQKIKERQAIPLPPGLDQLMMFAISSIRDVTGINLELLGQADREQAASLEQQRRQSAMTILATMFDNLRKYRKAQGRLMLQFIWMLPEGTLIRVIDQGQIQYLPLIKQGADIAKFDVVIDQAPSSPDQKQLVWGITQQILQMNILPPPAVVELLKYSPYPETVVAEIRKALGVDGEMTPQQLQQKLAQAEQALQIMEEKWKEASAKAEGEQDKNALEMMRIEIDEYKAETDRLKAQWQARLDNATAVMDAATTHHAAEAQQSNEVGEDGQPTGPSAPQSSLEDKVNSIAQMLQQLMGQSQGAEQAPLPPEEASGAGEQ